VTELKKKELQKIAVLIAERLWDAGLTSEEIEIALGYMAAVKYDGVKDSPQTFNEFLKNFKGLDDVMRRLRPH
jgi:hypothetical protein